MTIEQMMWGASSIHCMVSTKRHFTQWSQSSASTWSQAFTMLKGEKGSPYLITERRVLELILVLGSQPAGDVSHKPRSRLPLLSARPAVTLATLQRSATSFAAWWTEAQWVWTVCLRLLPDSVAAVILNPGPSAPESSMLTTRLPSHPTTSVK